MHYDEYEEERAGRVKPSRPLRLSDFGQGSATRRERRAQERLREKERSKARSRKYDQV